MNSLAKNSLKSPFDPLLYAWKSLFLGNLPCRIDGNKVTASIPVEFASSPNWPITLLMSYNYHYTTQRFIVFGPN